MFEVRWSASFFRFVFDFVWPNILHRPTNERVSMFLLLLLCLFNIKGSTRSLWEKPTYRTVVLFCTCAIGHVHVYVTKAEFWFSPVRLSSLVFKETIQVPTTILVGILLGNLDPPGSSASGTRISSLRKISGQWFWPF